MLKIYRFLILCLTFAIFCAITTTTLAVTVEDLQNKSASLSEQIKALDKEILSINKNLNSTTKEKNTLATELKKIETNRQALLKELKLTESKIDLAGVNISKLAIEITGKVRDIESNKVSISEALRKMRDEETNGLINLFLSDDRLSDILARTEQLNRLQSELEENVLALKENKETLEVKKTATETEKKNLTGLKNQLSGQKVVVEETKNEKNQLLAVTKSKESNFQTLLAEKLAKKQQVETEMATLEQQIKIAIDTGLLPTVGSSPLSWPVARVIITQYFGNTAFANAHTVLYNGRGHNGVDLGVSLGSAIVAPADGVVEGAGNTDTACQGASYGKWILIKHNNGLSTLYGHLSAIKVAEGQTVTRGEMIGLSGNTGFSTGPHLHFGVYASEGVKVSSIQSKVRGCGVYRVPLASYNAYLNPLAYLPPVPK